MNRDELSKIITACLEKTIPEADAATLDTSSSLRDQLDIDSMDMLRFVRALHAATGVDIPDGDTPKLETLEGALAYLSAKIAA